MVILITTMMLEIMIMMMILILIVTMMIIVMTIFTHEFIWTWVLEIFRGQFWWYLWWWSLWWLSLWWWSWWWRFWWWLWRYSPAGSYEHEYRRFTEADIPKEAIQDAPTKVDKYDNNNDDYDGWDEYISKQ